MISLICSAVYFGKVIEVFILTLVARTPKLKQKKPQRGARGRVGLGLLIFGIQLIPQSST